MSSAGGSSASASLHVGAGWRVQCSTYPATAPILTVDAGRCAVSVSIAGPTVVSAGAVAFARELARQAERFAAECERLHAAHANKTEGPEAA